MAGLVPAIQSHTLSKNLDARVKPAHEVICDFDLAGGDGGGAEVYAIGHGITGDPVLTFVHRRGWHSHECQNRITSNL